MPAHRPLSALPVLPPVGSCIIGLAAGATAQMHRPGDHRVTTDVCIYLGDALPEMHCQTFASTSEVHCQMHRPGDHRVTTDVCIYLGDALPGGDHRFTTDVCIYLGDALPIQSPPPTIASSGSTSLSESSEPDTISEPTRHIVGQLRDDARDVRFRYKLPVAWARVMRRLMPRVQDWMDHHDAVH